MVAAYTVHEPMEPADPVARAERVAFVKDGFSWPALFFAPLWLIYHRMWLVLVLFVAVAGLAPITLTAFGLKQHVAGWVLLAIGVLFALYANDLRRWTLDRRRYRMAGAVSGRNRDECERRFFAQWVDRLGHGAAATMASGAADAAAPRWRSRLWSVRRPGPVAIVDYGSGNLHSAAKAFERAARQAGDGRVVTVSADPEAVARADRIVLPGVGAFADCMNGLKAIDGMVEALEEAVRVKGKPFLGICVGMQLMATRGREHVTSDGLNWIAGEVRRIAPADPALKIPHMGWNTLDLVRMHPLLDGIALGPDGLHAYFVHSYQFAVSDRAHLVAETDHGGPVTAVVARDNMAGTQFHPEKSQALGLALIANFLKWRP